MKPTFLAIIPARGGSKGVPRKNIKELAGKPLIAWTIEEAKKSKYIDRLILSSEDEEIIEVAKQYGCEVPFKRPMVLAQDDTPGMDPVLHAIEQCPDYDYVVILQPTSPLRTIDDIDGCIEKVLSIDADFSVSVTEVDKSPYWMYTLENNKMVSLLSSDKVVARSQELPKVYALNGALYIGKTQSLIKEKSFLMKDTIPYIMGSLESIDIDSEKDFILCDLIKKNYNKN